jgi:hypothetical protein
MRETSDVPENVSELLLDPFDVRRSPVELGFLDLAENLSDLLRKSEKLLEKPSLRVNVSSGPESFGLIVVQVVDHVQSSVSENKTRATAVRLESAIASTNLSVGLRAPQVVNSTRAKFVSGQVCNERDDSARIATPVIPPPAKG